MKFGLVSYNDPSQVVLRWVCCTCSIRPLGSHSDSSKLLANTSYEFDLCVFEKFLPPISANYFENDVVFAMVFFISYKSSGGNSGQPGWWNMMRFTHDLLGGDFKYVCIVASTCGDDPNLTCAYFSDGWWKTCEKPPTSLFSTVNRGYMRWLHGIFKHLAACLRLDHGCQATLIEWRSLEMFHHSPNVCVGGWSI